MRPNTVADFWKKVATGDGCWTWTRGKDGDGYGMFHWKNRMVKAHRFSYELANGPIPKGLEVRHTCDNPSCVRPCHLLLGTQKDNAADREARGRGVKGRKLSPEHVAKVAAKRRDKKWTTEMKIRMSLIRRGLLPKGSGLRVSQQNILDEGGHTDLDEYLNTGSTVGLVRTDTMFEELK